MLTIILVSLGCYLLGAIPFSHIVATRRAGLDLREVGSGNLGATNVFRNVGPAWGLVVLILDMAKGAAAVALMTAVVAGWPEGRPTPLHLPPDVWRILAGLVAALGHTLSPFVGFKGGKSLPVGFTYDAWRIIAGLLAAIGHSLSPFVRFRGGKGVATTAGAFFVLAPWPLVFALVVFAIVFALKRIVSLASLCAAALLPVATIYFEWKSDDFSWTLSIFTVAICIFVVVRHQENIKRLRQGEEKPLVGGDKDETKG